MCPKKINDRQKTIIILIKRKMNLYARGRVGSTRGINSPLIRRGVITLRREQQLSLLDIPLKYTLLAKIRGVSPIVVSALVSS
jgi:hypothetical protein